MSIKLPPELLEYIIKEYYLVDYIDTIVSIPFKNKHHIIEVISDFIQESVNYICHLCYSVECDFIDKPYIFNKEILLNIYKHILVPPFIISIEQHNKIYIKSSYNENFVLIQDIHNSINILYLYYFIHLKFHNTYGPAMISWNKDTGLKLSENYYVNNIRHNSNGPAVNYWHKTGFKSLEKYYVDNMLHRIDDPAQIQWDENGNIIGEYYKVDPKVIKN